MGSAGRHATAMLPAIITSDAPMRSSSVPLPEHGYGGQGYGSGQNQPQLGLQLSPTTPRQSRFLDAADTDGGGSLRPGHRPPGSVGGSPNLRGSVPSSPIEMKARGLSAGEKSRERRQSSNSARSTGSARPRETASDYVFGEELGRGSYSTVCRLSFMTDRELIL
jgi:3-phosphoinositide dependent protein kinase-1